MDLSQAVQMSASERETGKHEKSSSPWYLTAKSFFFFREGGVERVFMATGNTIPSPRAEVDWARSGQNQNKPIEIVCKEYSLHEKFRLKKQDTNVFI